MSIIDRSRNTWRRDFNLGLWPSKHLINLLSILLWMQRNHTSFADWGKVHDKLKTRLKETIHKAFSHRNYGSKFVVLGYNSTYFSNKIQKGKTCYSEEQVISMLEFLIDNIFVSFGGTLFQQVVGIPIYFYTHMSRSFFKSL